MSQLLFPSWPSFSKEEQSAVASVLMSGRVNYHTGREGRQFEKEFADWCGTDHAIAIANGTLALELIWDALALGPGDEVIVTPRTFLASASSVVNVGATPVFADIDPNTQNICPDSVAKVLTENTKAILCVHLAGLPCDMDELAAIVGEREIVLVEDCAQAHGARYKGRPVGSLGKVAAWSFCQDKIMTTGGEGGMITTSDPVLYERIWSLKDHGKSQQAMQRPSLYPGFKWVHESFGTNARLTEMQSVLGRIQLKRMNDWTDARTRNALRILSCAKKHQVFNVPVLPENIEHAWYKCYIFVRPNALKSGWDRDRIMQEITDRGVPCYSGSCPEIYREKAFEKIWDHPHKRLPVARELGETSLMFLVHPTLGPEHVEQMCTVIDEIAIEATP